MVIEKTALPSQTKPAGGAILTVPLPLPLSCKVTKVGNCRDSKRMMLLSASVAVTFRVVVVPSVMV